MNKQFQKIKIFMIFMIILCSSLFVICPITNSAPLDSYFKCEPVLVIEFNETILQDPIVPLGQARAIPMIVKARIKGPADDIVSKYIAGALLIVRISIDEVPKGCHMSVSPPLIGFPVSNEFVSDNITVSITVDQNAVALTQERAIIRLKSGSLGSSKTTVVSSGNVTQEIPFTIGYYPQLGVSTPEGNVKNIHPDETVCFPIELQNLGNGNTEVTSEIVDIPEGWIGEIITSTTLGTNLLGGNPKKTISLKIRPSIDFGYHEDRAVIRVSITPSYYKNPEFEGEPHYLSFVVQSKGFSTPGFDIIILLFAFIFVVFPIWKRKNCQKGNRQLKRRKIWSQRNG